MDIKPETTHRPKPRSTAKRTIARPPTSLRARSRRQSRCACEAPEATRRLMGLAITVLIAISIVSSIWTPAALAQVERLLPFLTLAYGYYYGRLQA
jgi:hypothetical protein